jgi:hypothetical protein
MTHPTEAEVIERMAKAIYESRNGRGCRSWGTLPNAHKAPYLTDAKAAQAAAKGDGDC